MNKKSKYVEVMDTTLRDGEQTPGVSFRPEEKLQVAKVLLGEVKVDRIEVGSARVSEGEGEGAEKIFKWAEKAGKLDRVEILGFTDGGKSVDWIANLGGKAINLLTKGSEKHCRTQLRKEPEDHYNDACEIVEYAHKKGLIVNVYLEDWSNGIQDNPEYVREFIRRLAELPTARIMLPDTLGIMNPLVVGKLLEMTFSAAPKMRYDFHGHNDYGLATANSLAAVAAGINCVHTTVNSLGERAGNQCLAEFTAVLHDMSGYKSHINETKLDKISQIVQSVSTKRISSNRPVLGGDVFTQTCGVHADGDKKGNLYANPLLPERFGRKRKYALGKLSGKASIEKNLENLKIDLTPEQRKAVLTEVIRLGDRKKKITPEDLPFIIADVLKSPQSKVVEVIDYNVASQRGETPVANVKVQYKDKVLKAKSTGDGGYDAFMKAIRKALRSQQVLIPKLLDYTVHIPPGGKTDALVETTITWDVNGEPMMTLGVDSDQLVAAIEATEKMLNLVLNQG